MAKLFEEDKESREKVTSELDYVSQIIAAMNPDNFLDYKTKDELNKFRKLLKEDFWKAVSAAKGKIKSPEDHVLAYNSSQETLEPVYFWVLDKLNTFFKEDVTKYIDNFSSSPGSGHFAEMGARATKMQEESMKIMQTIGILVKSLVNIIYDLKEFEIRLSQYKSANSKDKDEAEAGLLALKQIWMDNVDIKRGRGSINMLAQDLQFVTIRDAFMVAKSIDDLKKMDLNDRVKRILEPRLAEFLKWRDLSERELKKRYDIEKNYLKNQVASLRMYTRWAKPYLRAASQLEMKNMMRSPALVTAFSTTLIQLTLLGKSQLKVEDEIYNTNLPNSFKHSKYRKCYSCVLVDFYFRGIPERLGQNYAFGGRVQVNFRSFALNEDELKMLEYKMNESDLNDALSIATDMTEGSLDALREDLEYFLKDEGERTEEKEERKASDDVNPFMALFGLGNKKPKEKSKDKKIIKIKPDSYVEKTIRKLAQKKADNNCFDLFDIYKKAHGMPSYPSPYDLEIMGKP